MYGPGGIYKPAQGYWVRVMTAVLVGMLFAAGAAWVWQQLSAVSLPMSAWNITVRSEGGGSLDPLVGVANVPAEFQVDGALPGERKLIGTGTIERGEQGLGETRVLRITSLSGFDAATRASPADASFLTVANTTYRIESRNGIPIFQLAYLQAAGAMVMIVAGFLVVYIYVARKPSAVEFLIATDGEMRKVNWSTWREIRGSTWVVVVATFLLAGIIFVIDIVFKFAFEQIGLYGG